jgi:hypothetical protein
MEACLGGKPVSSLGSHEVDQWGFVLYISVETKPSTRSTGSEREAERGGRSKVEQTIGGHRGCGVGARAGGRHRFRQGGDLH